MSRLTNAIVNQISAGKKAIPFTFVKNVLLEAAGENKSAKIEPTKSDFLVTDVLITAYDADSSLISGSSIQDLFTLNIKHASNGEQLFQGGIDITNFMAIYNKEDRINPFLIDKNAQWDFEIKHENVTSSGYTLPITIQVVVHGVYLYK